MRCNIPVTQILDSLSAAPAEADAALVLRHAERDEIPPGTFGVDISLTDNGVFCARRLGEMLSDNRRLSVTSSPVPRCVQTAGAILQGAGRNIDIVLDRRLGDPGPFVVDPEVAGPLFLKSDVLDIVRRQLSDSEPTPGMRPTSDGVRMLLDLVATGLESRELLNAYVTHDSILIVLVARLFGMSIDEVGCPNYLDGLLLWRSCGRLQAAWRGIHKSLDPLAS